MLAAGERGTILLCSQQLWREPAAERGGEKRASCCRSRAGRFRHQYSRGTGSKSSGVPGGLPCGGEARSTEQRDTELALGAFGSISHSLPSAVGGEDICCRRWKGLGGWENIRVLASSLSTPVLVLFSLFVCCFFSVCFFFGMGSQGKGLVGKGSGWLLGDKELPPPWQCHGFVPGWCLSNHSLCWETG